jgi:SAM-dependent methyltransferase
MDSRDISDCQSSYDAIAKDYADRIYDELKGKPLDRRLLDAFATRVNGSGRVCDIGCGPGHVARYLHDRGVDVFGVDLSPGMLEQARRLNPGMDFRQGNMLSLEFDDTSLAALVAFYSILHIPRAEVSDAFREFHRVLKPGGLLFLAFHIGLDLQHEEDCWGHKVALDFVFFTRQEVRQYLLAAGFIVEDSLERDPYTDVEVQTRRAYILAKKPA